MSDETTLLPCPFCGGEPDEYDGDYGNGVYCMHCGAMVGEPIHNEWHVDGRVTYEQAAEAWNTRVPHGTLTAEQVRDVVYRNSTYNDIYEVYQVSLTDMQAIADELNAKFGGGTCEFVDCGICKFYHADIQLCEYGIPPCSKFERKAVERWRCSE